MNSRIDDLEVRFAYQEAAVEELSQTVIEQQKRIEELTGRIEYLMTMLKDMRPSAVAPLAEETPPPHY